MEKWFEEEFDSYLVTNFVKRQIVYIVMTMEIVADGLGWFIVYIQYNCWYRSSCATEIVSSGWIWCECYTYTYILSCEVCFLVYRSSSFIWTDILILDIFSVLLFKALYVPLLLLKAWQWLMLRFCGKNVVAARLKKTLIFPRFIQLSREPKS